jgi:predicted RNA-binding protein
MDVMDLNCEDVKWIEVAQDRVQYPDLLTTFWLL